MQIQFIDPANKQALFETDEGLSDSIRIIYPKIQGAHRIVYGNNYTQNFGFQWNKFTETQVDTLHGVHQSQTRFFGQTQWDKENLNGLNILEIGSGAGRFTQVVLQHTEANLYSVDYSNAVEANYKNNGKNDRLHLFQASIYELPFAPAQFDKVFCFGVLQHTPDVEKTVKTLIDMTIPGGEVIVDFYPIKGWWTKINAKYLLRPWTKKMSNEQLYHLIEKNIDVLITIYRFFIKIKLGFLTRFIPVCDIEQTLPKGLSKKALREWCILDTFDQYSPEFDQPQRLSTVVKWFEKYGMKQVEGQFIHFDHVTAPVVKGVKSL